MRLRLYHHRDGARVAYRETGTGPAIVLLHSLGLSHREWEPIVAALAARFRVVVPDLPLHGDSEDRPRHPYTLDWLADVIAGFCVEVGGPRPMLAGHDIGAELALRAIVDGRLDAGRLVLMPNRLHRREQFAGRADGLAARRAGRRPLPGLDRLCRTLTRLVFRPSLGERLSAQRNPAARDLVRHAFADVGGNANRARSWAKFARRWPIGAAARPARRLPADQAARAAAVGRARIRAHPLDGRPGGARPDPRRPAADAARDRVPGGLRRPGRRSPGS